MATENKSNKLITITLALIITIAAITIIYINLPKDENGTEINDGNEQENEIILQMLYNDTYKNYTLDQLENLETFTGSGGYIKSNNITVGPFELTGVKISTILNQYNIESEKYSISVKAADDYPPMILNLSVINGDIPVYNETGEQIGIGNATMIIYYKQDGKYLDELEGPLRLGFIYEDGFTSSKIWIKQVISILIVDDF